MPDRPRLWRRRARHCAARSGSRRPARWRQAPPDRRSLSRSAPFPARGRAVRSRTVPSGRGHDHDRSCPGEYRKKSGYVEAEASANVTQKSNGEAVLPDYLKIEKGLGPDGRIAVVRFDRGDGINALSPEI